MEFGKTLYQLRKRIGLSQKELADLLGVAQASINYWEKGQRIPSLEAAKKISEYFDISLDKLTNNIASDIVELAENDVSSSSELKSFEIFLDYLKDIGCNMIVNSKTIFGNRETTCILSYDGKNINLSYDDLMELSNDSKEYVQFKIEQLFKQGTNIIDTPPEPPQE